MPTENCYANPKDLLPLGALCPICEKLLVAHKSRYGVYLVHLSGECENVAQLSDKLELFDVDIQIHKQVGSSQ